MGESGLPGIRPRHHGGAGSAPDPLVYPDLYQGVAIKRVIAYLIDVVIIAIIATFAAVAFTIAGILTFGVLNPLLILAFAVIPLAYHVLLLGGRRSATIGMRWLGIELRSISLGRPDYLQAAVQTVLFYLFVALTSWLILIVALFNGRRRTLHDMLAGTYVVNRYAAAATLDGAPPDSVASPDSTTGPDSTAGADSAAGARAG